ncbi:MAG: hypothetical protein O7C61_05355 [SAR324 cluster bacterium]|nr:hypothetical protein [SAR324 cluster bacterium]MCZ6842775.1 hypothetical protein [SAR324 cluster bacterium]
MITKIRITRWALPLLVLVLLTLSASAAYGYVWYSQVQADIEYKKMIHNLGMPQGEGMGCLDG